MDSLWMGVEGILKEYQKHHSQINEVDPLNSKSLKPEELRRKEIIHLILKIITHT